MFSIRTHERMNDGKENIKKITAMCDAYWRPRTKFSNAEKKLPITNPRPVSWILPKATDLKTHTTLLSGGNREQKNKQIRILAVSFLFLSRICHVTALLTLRT
jgi:hypothetical protein